MNKGNFLILIFTSLFYCCAYAQQDTILIDFGNVESSFPWNNISNPTNGSLSNLNNSDGLSTGFSVSVSDAFNGINNSGTLEPNIDLGIPMSASGDSFFGNTVIFSNNTEPTGGVTFNGLDPASSYTIQIFSSRVATDNRDTKYIISGNATDSLTLGVSSNQSDIINYTTEPDATGVITITASPGESNNNDNGFFYLGVIKLIYDEIDLGDPMLSLTQPTGGEFWQVGKTAEITWTSNNLSKSILEYSIDNGNQWMLIDTVSTALSSYLWTIPDMPSTDCIVRISSDTLLSTSEEVFEISNDNSTCAIVILGSSTAAGTGPSSPDSTWVNRYRNSLSLDDTRFEITNLARGGYTTYHILPDDAEIDPSIGISVDSSRNITQALTENPYAIIINMPSNDAANFFSVEDQIRNFNTIISLANDEGAEVWVCTTQPRNFGDDTRIMIQEEARDSILSIYGDKAIDFWSGISDTDGRILQQYDSGDGVHLNDAAHKILLDRVSASMIDTLCGIDMTSSYNQIMYNEKQISIKYIGSDSSILFEYEADINSTIKYELYDLQARNISETKSRIISSGLQSYKLKLNQLDELREKIIIARLTISNGSQPIKEYAIKLFVD